MGRGILDTFLGRAPALEQAEEDLGKPLEAEAHNLNLHVIRCAQRWQMSYRTSKENSAQLAQLRLIVLVIGIVMVLTQQPIAKWVSDHLL